MLSQILARVRKGNLLGRRDRRIREILRKRESEGHGADTRGYTRRNRFIKEKQRQNSENGWWGGEQRNREERKTCEGD